MVGRVTAAARLALADRHLGVELMEAVEDLRVGDLGHEDLEVPPDAARDDRGSQGGVPAAGDCQRPWRGGCRSSGHLQFEQRAEQVARLVRAGDVAGLVLDPHAGVLRESQAFAQGAVALERGHAESRAVHVRQVVVESLDEVDHVSVGPARGTCGVTGMQERAVADEGIRLVTNGEGKARRRQDPTQDVVDIVAGSRGRAARAHRFVLGEAIAAAGADEGGRQPTGEGIEVELARR